MRRAIAIALVLAACASADPEETRVLSGPSAVRISAVEEPPQPAATAAADVDGMLGVPGGTFTMGTDNLGEGDEQPAHAVTVAPFLLDRTEVANAAYGECVAAGVCRPHDTESSLENHLGPDAAFRGPSQPISGVSHKDAEAFCAWKGKRLPTEAEWERAARGSDGRRYPWGSDPANPQLAVYGGSMPMDVGSKPKGAGPYGHLDLAGNVWEWVADLYDPYAYRRPDAAHGMPGTCPEIKAAQDELRRKQLQGFTGKNPIPADCDYVLRGGAFNYGGPGLRASNRVHHPGTYRLIMSGFRCAKDWPDGPRE
jgi:formylglycine-generating enzyme required for sulfatase activity